MSNITEDDIFKLHHKLESDLKALLENVFDT